MQHRFAAALEAKVARLDDAGVDRAHGNLVHSYSFDAEEGVSVCPGAPFFQLRVPEQGLQPWMAVRAHAERLEDLALERLRRGDLRRERGERRPGEYDRTKDAQPPGRIRSEHREQVHYVVRCRPPPQAN